MIVLQLSRDEAEILAETLAAVAGSGARPLVAWDPIDRAVKVKNGTWSPPLGTVIADD